MLQSVEKTYKNNIKSLAKLKENKHNIGKLKFISDYKSIDLKQYKNTYRFKGNKVKIQNIPGYMVLRGLWQLEGKEIANAKIINKPDGYYLKVITFVYKTEIVDKYIKDSVIGIDMGLGKNFTLSDNSSVNIMVEELNV